MKGKKFRIFLLASTTLFSLASCGEKTSSVSPTDTVPPISQQSVEKKESTLAINDPSKAFDGKAVTVTFETN